MHPRAVWLAGLVALHLVALFLPMVLTGSQFSSEQTLEGGVIDSTTGMPISSVLVTVRLQGLEPSFTPNRIVVDPPDRPMVQVTTDSDGHFSIPVPASRFEVVFGKSGYGVRTLRYSTSRGKSVSGAVVRLAPTGAIAGRVVDAQNNPIPSVYVMPLVYRYSGRGRELVRFTGVRTDDHGEFRLFHLPPNEYILLFASPAGSSFYPGVTELSEAESVSLVFGKETRLRAIVLSGSLRQGTIRVRLANPSAGAKDVTYNFANSTPTMLEPGLDGSSLYEVPGLSSSSDPIIHLGPSRVYTFSHDVRGPGTYRAIATWKDGAGRTVRSSVSAEFTGTNLDMDLILQTPDGTLSCRVMLEEASGTLSPLPNTGVLIQDAPARVSSCYPVPELATSTAPFRTGKYQVLGVQGIPADAYVARATQGERDALADGLEVTRDSQPLEVRVSRGAGIIRGTVMDRQGHIVHDALVAAVLDSPAGSIPRLQAYPSDRTDQNGVYEIRGLRPGTYRLFTWSLLDEAPLWNPEFIKKLETRGTNVVVEERDILSCDLTILDGTD